MKKILIISDSLGLPTLNTEMKYKDSYPYMIKREFEKGNEFFIISIRGLTTKNVYRRFYDYIGIYEPDIIILQTGIVDCVPRLFTEKEQMFFFNFVPIFLRKKILNLFSSNRLFFTKIFNKTYSSNEEFFSSLLGIVKEALKINVEKIFIYNIADPSEKLRKRSYKIQQKVEKANRVINKLININKEKINIIDVYNLSKKYNIILENDHHLNYLGHKMYFQEIKLKLMEVLDKK